MFLRRLLVFCTLAVALPLGFAAQRGAGRVHEPIAIVLSQPYSS